MNIVQSKKGSLTLLCRLAGRSRQAYYQQVGEKQRLALQDELIVKEILQIRKNQRYLGGRKLYYLLGSFFDEHSMAIGRDAFFGLLGEYGLLVRKRKARKPRTTFSCWWMKKYRNLAKDLVPLKANQLWVGDITYIRTDEGFGYLSLVTDAYSRKIVGYHLSEDLLAAGCVRALKMALAANPDRDRLIHHSDRGVQYYSNEYREALGENIRISMSAKSDPLENAIAERVNGILKGELLDPKYKSIAAAKRSVAQAVSIYNNLRPHSSIENLTPAEAHTRTGPLKKYWKNYFRYSKAEAFQAMV
jgi:hypothetical protein